ncbi:hypothetical protein Kpol_1033p31 [Vanderwaltozyma polyspora DSM 70294]|uniref:Peptidase S59 domain-containing protein n=1 Tax=Vanderwaltozyma polyspora (strain ATCC 22028 / DSM 70294 / BCRC 21397 / CBS 2163 / NBRC 10782 / NRRL Y-8283 / UCD 57-17) TaxID=436907 RepID=A7TJ27_VANPO|nr:uncharacterized protein Kpol_1033p31 [Vanderwaltozyma polyspora DSM 70294]EDO17726.1 hypothetical protein Kpol_1033p31 [Vanderwaltozyma polyspora DSM 70294]
MFSRNPNNTNTLFGNVNTATPTSTPTPAANNFQLPSKPNTLFGNVTNNNTNIGASTPSPSSTNTGGLFGNTNTATGTGGGLFGGSSTNSAQIPTAPPANTTGGLFGSKPTQPATTGNLFGSTNNSTTTSGSLFGNNSTTNAPKTGLFGSNNAASTAPAPSVSLFGNSATQQQQPQSSGLFGNKSTLSTSTSGGLFGNNIPTTTNTSSYPYGLNIGATPSSLTTMPESITASLGKNKKITESLQPSNSTTSAPKLDSRRSSSVVPTANIRPTSNSSLINKLNSRLNLFQKGSSTQGIFSRSKRNEWSNTSQNNIARDILGSNNLSESNSKNGVVCLPNNDVSDMRKLKIEPNRSAAKKLKLFSGEAKITKENNNENNSIDSSETLNNDTVIEPTLNNKTDSIQPKLVPTLITSQGDEGKTSSTESEYWCSPSIEQLSNMTIQQLSEVSHFVIGRKNYGCITFNFPVDLTAFASDLKGFLFGNIVNFYSTRTVEVYPDEESKPQIGYGINVPATITIEDVYPTDRNTGLPIKDVSRIDELQLFVDRLRNQRDMEFISYNPHSGSWTFKVKHFSIWGLIEDDEENNKQLSNEEKKKSTSTDENSFNKSALVIANNVSNFTAKKLAISKVIGSEIGNDLIESKQSFIESAEMSSDRQDYDYSNYVVGEDSVDIQMNNDDLIVEEKQYEPDVEEKDFEGLEENPNLDISNRWVDQLKIAGSSLRSVFRSLKDPSLNNASHDLTLLFDEFNDGMELEKRVKSERRITSYKMVRFCHDSRLLTNESNTVKLLHTPVCSAFNEDIVYELFEKHLNSVQISNRESNAYPVIESSTFTFSDIALSFHANKIEQNIWKLCSVLFDCINISYDVESESEKSKLLKNIRFSSLCKWIVEQTSHDILTRISTTSDDLDKIFLYLALNDIVSATETAIKSNNGHLAVLITYLGSNNPRIREFASLQLSKWDMIGHTVDKKIRRIFELLSGSLFNNRESREEISIEFGWLTQFGLNIFYSQVDEYELEEIVRISLEKISVSSDKSYYLLKTFASRNIEDVIKNTSVTENSLDMSFLWYFIQVLRHYNSYRFSDGFCDNLTINHIEELKIDGLYKEALFATSFIINDKSAKQEMDNIVMHEILGLKNDFDKHILDKLHVPSSLINQALALYSHYEHDYLSEVRYLLKADDFKSAETVLTTNVAPYLILKGGSDLIVLRQLLNSFAKDRIENWNNGLGVFEYYLSLVLDKQDEKPLLEKLISSLPVLAENNKSTKMIYICCNEMSRVAFSIIIKKFGDEVNNALKVKLLKLPVGQPEKAYLQSVLTKV